MTKIHHLNLGAMRAIPVDPTSITSCHCWLLEDPNGLVLIDSGLGLIEMEHPLERFGEQLLNIWGFTIDENLTALRQLQKLGFNPADVQHMLETELRNRGANFVDRGLKADHVEHDGNLITGQNPWSSARIAREIARALQAKN